MAPTVSLRDVRESDLPIFFEQQLDPTANYMAAFASANPADRDAFMVHWRTNLADEANTNKTILLDEQVAGNIVCYEDAGRREVGYWIGKLYWGKGTATAALAQFLQQVPERPLYARAAKDNRASLRVLQKCGFTIVGEDKGFANARGEEVEEWILQLDLSER